MSKQSELNSYIRQLQQRLRLGASLRGVTILTAAALTTTVVLVLVLNAFAFPQRGLASTRAVLFFLLAVAALFGLVLPLLRLTQRRSIAVAEATRPEFQQRLVTFYEREEQGNDSFLELLAANTLSVAQDAPPASLVPDVRLFALAGVGVACLGVLIWMIAAGPGYLGYGASLIWTGPKHDRAPLYDIQVTPGDAAVRRNSDQLVTARIIGLRTDKVRLLARYQSAEAKSGGWEPVAMQPQQGMSGTDAFQFLFAGLPENVEYYVEAGPIKSRHFKIRVVDLPSVKQIRVTYHYPKWTGLQQVSDEHGGDLRAIEGTRAEIEVQMDHPLSDGLLALDDGRQIHLTGGEDNQYRGVVPMEKDGAYHVATIDEGQQVRLSEDYFIATNKANPPDIAIDRPDSDYRASPIEEVTVGVKAADEFGLNHVSLHYSVNGGAERSIDLMKQPGAKNVTGTATLSLEDFKLVPGDVVSLYATARDGHAEAHTEMSFIQADPFEREFSQSQQSGGGGGGGGQGQSSQTDISKREKELIAATWKQRNEKNATVKEAADAGKFLSEVQTKLREQVLALSGRMQSRDLTQANEEFNSFERDMQTAASAMAPSAEKLKGLQWQDAIPNEQKALQYLLRAEATFRKIEVAFGQQGGGGGGGGSAGRDLASLFDLELDTEKNQYETAQTGSAADQRAKAVDDVLQKLDALARRQEELAQQQHNAPPTFQERWQQEMLRREAEQLQHQMEQLAQNNAQGQQGDQQNSNGSSSNSSASSSGQSKSSQSRADSSQMKPGSSQAQSRNQSRTGGDTADPRVEQALSRLREADDAMRRSAGQQQSPEAARQAAEQLRQATNLLSGSQRQEASGKLDRLSREADRLGKEEHTQADRINSFAAQQDATNGQDAPTQEQRAERAQELGRLASERQRLSDDLAQLEKGLRDTARELAPNQPQASSKLRDALSGMDQEDLSNRVQRTADWLRRGVNPNSNGTEAGIGKDLQRLNDQVRQAQQGLGADAPPQGKSQGDQTAALEHVERLRNQLESLAADRRNGEGRTPGHGGQQGQQSKDDQQGQEGAQGQQIQAGRQGRSGQQGQSSRAGQQGQADGQRGDNGQRQGGANGDVGNGGSGGGEGTAWGNINTGNNRFDRNRERTIAPDNTGAPAGEERAYRDGLMELNQLRQLAKNDPETLKEIQDLIREMERLDPSRFPGNPAMVEQLHTEVLNGVDKLELQLRRSSDDQSLGQVRTSKPTAIPAGYQDAVAEYYRRLSKSQ
jgi:hypothetical protein